MKQPRSARKPAPSSTRKPAGAAPVAPPAPFRPALLEKIPERFDPWLVFAVALLVRLVYVAVASYANPSFDAVLKGFDQFTYQQHARHILDGDLLLRKVGLFYYSPIYAYFTAFVFKIFGDPSYLALHLIQAVISALTCTLCFLLARTWLGRPAALLAGFLFAFMATWLFYEQELLHEGLMLLFYAVALWGLRTAQLGGRWPLARLALAGVFGMLAMIGRGNAALVLLALIPWVALAVPGTRRVMGRFNAIAALAFCAGLALVCVPLLARNHAVAGRLTLGMGNGKVLFYIGNNAQATGEFAYTERFQQAFTKGGQTDGKVYAQFFWEDLKTAPGHMLGLLLRKTYFFFAARDLPDNLNFQLGRRLIPVAGFTPVQWEWVVPLGLAGLGLSIFRRRQWSLLWVFTAVFAASLILIIPVGRYRQPVLIPLLIWAAFAVEWAGGEWRARRFGALAPAAAAFFALALTLWPWAGESIRVNDYQADIAMALKSKRLGVAERLVREGIRAYPNAVQIYDKAFAVAQAKGDRAEMHRLGEMLLQNTPISPEVALGMADLDVQEGNLQRAQMMIGSLKQAQELMADADFKARTQAVSDALDRALQGQAGQPAR